MPVEEALDGAVLDGSWRVDGEFESVSNFPGEGDGTVRVELVLENEDEAALFADAVNVTFRRVPDNEERA